MRINSCDDTLRAWILSTRAKIAQNCPGEAQFVMFLRSTRSLSDHLSCGQLHESEVGNLAVEVVPVQAVFRALHAKFCNLNQDICWAVPCMGTAGIQSGRSQLHLEGQVACTHPEHTELRMAGPQGESDHKCLI